MGILLTLSRYAGHGDKLLAWTLYQGKFVSFHWKNNHKPKRQRGQACFSSGEMLFYSLVMGIQRFKTFEEADEALMFANMGKELDIKAIDKFLASTSSLYKNPYIPGVYRFQSFEEADAFDIQQHIRQSVKSQ
jgi:hypothetical protein